MKLTSLARKVNDRLDEVLDLTMTLGWFDDAQNRLAIAVGAKFPQFLTSDGQQTNVDEPAIPEKYHEALVIYAVARYREMDSSTQEMDMMDSRFDSYLAEFRSHYEIPPMYRDSYLDQHFIVAVEGESTFTITKDSYNPVYTNPKFYVNGVQNNATTNGMTFTLQGVTTKVGDTVTATWDDAPSLVYRPENYYGW